MKREIAPSWTNQGQKYVVESRRVRVGGLPLDQWVVGERELGMVSLLDANIVATHDSLAAAMQHANDLNACVLAGLLRAY